MCYASANAKFMRDAVEGERLLITHHQGTINWVTAPGQPNVAVCFKKSTVTRVTIYKKVAGFLSRRRPVLLGEAIFYPELPGVPGNDFFWFTGENRKLRLDSFDTRCELYPPELEVLWTPKSRPQSTHDPKAGIDGCDDFDGDEADSPVLVSASAD